MKYECPGAAGLRTPAIQIKQCPHCGGEVELFSIDMKVDCPGCGHLAGRRLHCLRLRQLPQ